MRIDFTEYAKDQISIDEILLKYEFIKENNNHSIRLQNEKRIFQINCFGLFILGSLVFFFICSKSPVISCLGVIFTGITCLIASIEALIQDHRHDRQIIHFLKEGKRLERDYPNILKSNYFHGFERFYRHKRTLFKRIAPSGAIILLTIFIGTAFAINK